MLKFIRNDPLIRRLSLVQFISYFGSWFSNVAIYTMILQFGVDPLTNALVVSMYALPAFLAPLNGAVVDKFEFKRFMVILLFVELAMTLSFLFVQEISQVTLLMLFIFIRTSASLLFFNAEMSMLPQLFSGEKLKSVNQLHSVIWSITYALGMAIGGIAVDRLGIYNTILIDAVLFTVAIYLFLGIKLHIRKETTQSIKTLILEGFGYLKKHKLLLHLIFLHSAVAFTSFDALINLLTDTRYKYLIAIPLAIGWLNGIRAFGLMIGPMVIGKIVKTENLHLFFIIQGAIILIWALVEHSFYLSLFMMFLVGFLTTTLWSYTYTLVQIHTEAKYLGRVVAYNDMIFMIVSIVVTLFTGAAFRAGISLEVITGCLGTGFILSGFYFHWFQKTYHYFLKKKAT